MRLAIIPAKGQSRRLTAKNTRYFFGKPILAYSIEVARRSNLFDRILVSTDTPEVCAIARQYGAEARLRAVDASDPDMGTQELAARVTREICDREQAPRHVCVIYPCAPLVMAEDLQKSLDAMRRSHGLFAYAVHNVTMADAGAFYWSEGWALVNEFPLQGPHTVLYSLPDGRVQDVNDLQDWESCAKKYAALHPEVKAHA